MGNSREVPLVRGGGREWRSSRRSFEGGVLLSMLRRWLLSGTLTAPQKAEMIAGTTYLNIHTTANSGGEIRGNIGP